MKIEEIESEKPLGYLGECYAEDCKKDSTIMVIHHHHPEQTCQIRRPDNLHCQIFVCDKHYKTVKKGKQLALKPEFVHDKT
jgi:hypothetical protein